MDNMDKRIKTYMTFEWNFIDFFYAFCAAKGIEDPETDIETEEEYTALEEECKKLITGNLLSNLHEAIMQDANERIYYAMS